MDASGEIINGMPSVMQYQGAVQYGNRIYPGELAYRNNGFPGLSLRVIPRLETFGSPDGIGLIIWATPRLASSWLG